MEWRATSLRASVCIHKHGRGSVHNGPATRTTTSRDVEGVVRPMINGTTEPPHRENEYMGAENPQFSRERVLFAVCVCVGLYRATVRSGMEIGDVPVCFN